MVMDDTTVNALAINLRDGPAGRGTITLRINGKAKPIQKAKKFQHGFDRNGHDRVFIVNPDDNSVTVQPKLYCPKVPKSRPPDSRIVGFLKDDSIAFMKATNSDDHAEVVGYLRTRYGGADVTHYIGASRKKEPFASWLAEFKGM